MSYGLCLFESLEESNPRKLWRLEPREPSWSTLLVLSTKLKARHGKAVLVWAVNLSRDKWAATFSTSSEWHLPGSAIRPFAGWACAEHHHQGCEIPGLRVSLHAPNLNTQGGRLWRRADGGVWVWERVTAGGLERRVGGRIREWAWEILVLSSLGFITAMSTSDRVYKSVQVIEREQGRESEN